MIPKTDTEELSNLSSKSEMQPQPHFLFFPQCLVFWAMGLQHRMNKSLTMSSRVYIKWWGEILIQSTPIIVSVPKKSNLKELKNKWKKNWETKNQCGMWHLRKTRGRWQHEIRHDIRSVWKMLGEYKLAEKLNSGLLSGWGWEAAKR